MKSLGRVRLFIRRRLVPGGPLEALEGPLLLQLGDDVHALQPHLPRPPPEDRVPVHVHLSERPPQRLGCLGPSPELKKKKKISRRSSGGSSTVTLAF